ncbi:hypothetical protein FS837_007586, partial [Tulasnella sp. UAMH 9824]
MLLYEDIISGDELFSDAFPMKLVDDIVYEVDCAMIVVKDGDVDIGANPSAEEVEEALEDGAQQVNNVVHSFRLQSTGFDKKGYLTHLKQYMKAVEAKLTESGKDASEIKKFKDGAQKFATKVVGNIKNYDFVSRNCVNEVNDATDGNGVI